jgi:hypothetical protein
MAPVSQAILAFNSIASNQRLPSLVATERANAAFLLTKVSLLSKSWIILAITFVAFDKVTATSASCKNFDRHKHAAACNLVSSSSIVLNNVSKIPAFNTPARTPTSNC